MKKIIPFIIIIVNSIYCFSQSCSPNESVLTTNSLCSTMQTALKSSNQTLSARDKVVLTAGFTLNNTSGHSLTVATDHTIFNFYNYTSEISATKNSNGTTHSLDKTDYAPGSIGGVIDVSPTGAATYSFPILVSPGTMGVQPSLSVVYSSQNHNDLLGYGWHLSGLSTITRVAKNPYYDGSAYISNNPGVTLSSTDVFSLDGQRLIPNPNAANTYSPENDPYTYITFSNNVFTVTTKDGMVMEYGNNFVLNPYNLD